MKLTNEQIDELFRAIDYKEIIRGSASIEQESFIENAVSYNYIEIDIYYCFKVMEGYALHLEKCNIYFVANDSGGNKVDLEYDKDYFKAQETKLWIDIEKWLSE